MNMNSNSGSASSPNSAKTPVRSSAKQSQMIDNRHSAKEMYKKQIERLRQKDKLELSNQQSVVSDFKSTSLNVAEEKMDLISDKFLMELTVSDVEEDEEEDDNTRELRAKIAQQRLIQNTAKTPVDKNDDLHWVNHEEDALIFSSQYNNNVLSVPSSFKQSSSSSPSSSSIMSAHTPTMIIDQEDFINHKSAPKSFQRQLKNQLNTPNIPNVGLDDKIVTLSNALDILLSTLEMDPELSKRDRKVISLIRIKKQKMESERQKRWLKVLQMVRRINDIQSHVGLNYSRLTSPVPLNITNLDVDFEDDKEARVYDGLTTTFGTMNSGTSEKTTHRSFVRSRPSTSHSFGHQERRSMSASSYHSPVKTQIRIQLSPLMGTKQS
ncbi:hypothetical protein AKO1_014334 [Acrasis kona]|uniref:Uncharacterized protein n=1 Tax=Acrasis kona TaxID=1008807 RepID=A0AAW2YYY7_9EUKA